MVDQTRETMEMIKEIVMSNTLTPLCSNSKENQKALAELVANLVKKSYPIPVPPPANFISTYDEKTRTINCTFSVSEPRHYISLDFLIEGDLCPYLKTLPKGVCLRNGELVYEDEWGAYLSLDRAYQLGFLIKEELLTCGSEFIGILIKDRLI
jgi:hypothetical protein